MTHLAHDERLRLCATFDGVGPSAPTLCPPWSTRELAAHLVWRDGLFDLSPGRWVTLARGQARMASYADLDWPVLLDRVRSGPPSISPLALSAVDERLNTGELFIHHEDVLRAAPGWTPRSVPSDLESALWRMVALFGRIGLHSAPVGVELVAPGRPPRRVKAATDQGWVRVTGAPGELALYCSGRQRVAEVTLEGRSPESVSALVGFGRQ